VLWNLMGLSIWTTYQIAPESMLESTTVEMQEFMKTLPGWYNAAFAIAVITGLFSSLLLLFRKKHAVLMAVLSLVAVIATNASELSMGAWEVYQGADKFFLITVPLIGLTMWLFARAAKQRNWLR
jgi:hypothetical protein